MKATPIASAKVTMKGQITVPKEVREKLGIRDGDVVFFFEKNGHIVLTREVLLP